MAARVMLQLATTGYASRVASMVDQEAAREFDRLRAHLGFITAPEPLRIDGRYHVDRTLGRGAMGVVYLARDERLDRNVALKLVRSRPEMDHERLQLRLEREARALAKIEHPNIVAVYDVGRHGDETYFTMQYVPGDTLRQWQANASPAAVVDAYVQAARGLAAAHAVGVVHRDFKPDNALVGDHGRVQVADFGIAAALLSGEDTELQSASTSEGEPTVSSGSGGSMTRVGSFVGTVAYASPEQLQGSPADDRSDQFALCVSLWEALTEHRPFGGRTRDQLYEAIQGALPIDEGVPRWLVPILRRGLAFDPGDRFEGMDALVEAIERGRSRRRRRAVQAVAALGLTTALAAGWGLSSAAQMAAAPGCDAFVGQVDAIWGPKQRQALVAGAEAEEGGAAEHAASTLDGLAEGWSSSAGALCTEGLAPPADAEARRCHEAWLQSLERSVTLLAEHGDARTLSRAPDLLERLVPPQGDYCALQPSPAVEPEVWSLAEAAREAAIVGDFAGAASRAEAVVSRAEGLGDAGALTAHRAEAYAARAEVLARSGDFSGALQQFPVAERHAIGADYPRRLWWLRVLWAKVLALGEGPGAAERAAEHLRRAEPLAHALGEADSPLLAAELAEARGMVARALGNHREAIGEHQRAYEGFEALGRPLLAARALLGIGASHQLLGQMQRAWDAYEKAEALYERNDVPQGYRNRIRNRLNLGGLAMLAERSGGLVHLDEAVTHGSPDERLEAFALAIPIAGAKAEGASQWAERALAELRRHPEPPLQLAHDIELGAGVVIARGDRARGESLMKAAELRARQLPADVRVRTQQTWIEWLEATERCEEARVRLAEMLEHIPPAALASVPRWQQWRAERASGPCSIAAPIVNPEPEPEVSEHNDTENPD